MAIRAATDEDLDLVTRMRLEFLAEVRGLEVTSLPPALVDETRSYIDSHARSETLRSWVAEDDGEPVGIVSMLLLDMPPRPDDLRTREGYILNMWIAPPNRRRGMGRALFEECLAEARRSGVRRVFLHATDEARPMYDSIGFTPNADWMELRLP